VQRIGRVDEEAGEVGFMYLVGFGIIGKWIGSVLAVLYYNVDDLTSRSPLE
jgi:hypothetical protein